MSLVVAGNSGNIFSNGLSGDLEISNSPISDPLTLLHESTLSLSRVHDLKFSNFTCRLMKNLAFHRFHSNEI